MKLHHPIAHCLVLGTLVSCSPPSAMGTLEIRANGEDFVRQGFTTKDGWQLQFDHVYVTVGQVSAHQTNPPFDPNGEFPLTPVETVGETAMVKVDLAEDIPPLITTAIAPVGRYNAMEWQLVSPLVMVGTAINPQGDATETLPFDIAVGASVKFVCGDFIGDGRKGILQADETAEVEATLHFDHLFGDSQLPPEDELNQGALGFAPFAQLATGGQIAVDDVALRQELSPADYGRLQQLVADLGHVGEGHCQSEPI